MKCMFKELPMLLHEISGCTVNEVRGGSLRGFSEGDNIRVVRPKDNVKRQNVVKKMNRIMYVRRSLPRLSAMDLSSHGMYQLERHMVF